MMAAYTFVEGSRFAGDPQLIGERVKELETQSATGVCTSEAYVSDAMEETSPLHRTIEWDDGNAAWSWRNHQARQVVRSLRIIVDDEVQDAPAFVSVRIVVGDGVAQGYRTTTELPTRDLQEQVLQDTLKALNGYRRRHAGLKRLQPVWDALDSVIT